MVLAGAILPLKTQLPWYSHPLWLPFALVCAPLLAWLVERTDQQVPLRRLVLRIPTMWMLLGLLLLLATAGEPPVRPGACRNGWDLPRAGHRSRCGLGMRRLVVAVNPAAATDMWPDQSGERQRDRSGAAVQLPTVALGTE